MKLDDFEKFIDPVILGRGEDYYFNGNVINIEKITPDKWKAKVEGSEIYNVEITLNGEEIIDSYCDCPYDMGEYCKHQVASFYELKDVIEKDTISDKNIKKNTVKKLSKSEEIDKILANIERERLIEFIKDSALKDDKVHAFLISNFGLNNGVVDKSSYYKIINFHLNAAKDRHDFIDYYHAGQATEGAYTLIQNAEDAINNENYTEAITMAQCVVELMIPALQEVDDSDGDFGMVIDQGFEILYKCSDLNLNDNTRKDFFEYCLNEMTKKKYEGWPDWQLDFLCIAKNLAKEKNELDKLINIIDNYDNEDSRYFNEETLLLKYDILVKFGKLNEAEEFFKKNLHLPDFRKIAIEKAIEEHDYVKAEKLAIEGESINKEWPGVVNNWKKYRLRIYEDTKNIDKQREILKEFTMEESFEYYLKLKKSYNRNECEWQNVYHEIINKIKNKNSRYSSPFLMDIYVEEKLLNELLNEIQKEPSYIKEYDKFLLKDFSSEVYALYKKYLMNQVKYVNNRSNYQDLCNIIRRLIKAGGNNTAKEIIDFLQIEYKKRPAFMDELSKIKI